MPEDMSQRDSLVGTIVGGRYQVLSLIGEGGMGTVFLAEHTRMKRKSAIKIMRASVRDEPEALQRFTREAENASRISHPNVTAIFDFGETEDGLVYLAMEYVEGESLASMLDRLQVLHPLVVADIIAQTADGLQAAHDLGILHRDVKPDNIMLTTRNDGTIAVKLVDFGIARAVNNTGTQHLTRTGMAIGTPEYMSPEQLSGDVLDARSDQYSVALVAFHMLTGHDAFMGTSAKDSFIARLTSRPQRLDVVRGDLDWPVTLQDVFDTALAPDPVDRYANVSEFGNGLLESLSTMRLSETGKMNRPVLSERATRVVSGKHASVPETTAERNVASVSRSAASRRSGKYDRQLTRRRTRPAISRYLLLLAVATYGIWWYGAQQPPDTTMRGLSDSIGATSQRVKVQAQGWWTSLKSAAQSAIK